jgi:hypothetical protein
MTEQPEEQQNAENIEQENQMPQLPKFINPNSYVPVLEKITAIFGTDYVDNKNIPVQKYDEEIFDATIIGIYFSAGWASPCRIFSKDLIELYHAMNEGEKFFEIIQVSFDKSEEEFKKSIENLPWKFLSFNNPKINELKEKYNVTTVPKFVPIDKEGNALSEYGREDLNEYGVDILDKWNEDTRVVSQDEVDKLLEARKKEYEALKAQYEENQE